MFSTISDSHLLTKREDIFQKFFFSFLQQRETKVLSQKVLKTMTFVKSINTFRRLEADVYGSSGREVNTDISQQRSDVPPTVHPSYK